MPLSLRQSTQTVALKIGFFVLLCGCTVSPGGPEIVGGNEQGGIIDGISRGFGVEQMGIGSKKAFEMATVHCSKYGKSALVSPWTDGQMAFSCVKSASQ